MPNLLRSVSSAFAEAVQRALGTDADPAVIATQQEQFGDYQSNAAMGLAKLARDRGEKANPRAIAEQIRAALDLGDMASEVSIAGPGFINVRLSPEWLTRALASAAGGERLGIEWTDRPQTVVVDYSGPNIAKQMHVGHLRSTIIGDSISRMIEFLGHKMIRQNHIGDWGTQFGMLIAHLKSSSGDASAHIDDLEEFYREAKRRFDEDPAFQDKARRVVVRLQSHEPEELALWQRIVDETRRHYQPIYERLHVKLGPEQERGESFYGRYLTEVVRDLREAGIAVESEGAVAIFVDGYEAPLIIEKSGGGYLYATTDLAAIWYRVTQLGAQRIVYTHDSRQTQHFNQVFAAAHRAGWAKDVVLEFASFGTMLGEDGRPFKTRTGGTIKLKDLLDEAEERAYQLVTEKNPELDEGHRRAIASAVGIGAVKYADLSKDRNSDYVFSWDRMMAMDGNTAPYLQYAHARVKSIFRKANGDVGDLAALRLEHPFEIALGKHILRASEVIELAARELKPHYLCLYLYEMATRFSGFYENCPVLQSAPEVRSSRLALCEVTARTLELVLDLLGIEHPDQM